MRPYVSNQYNDVLDDFRQHRCALCRDWDATVADVHPTQNDQVQG